MLTIIGIGTRLQDISIGALHALMRCDAALLRDEQAYIVDFLRNSDIPYQPLQNLFLPRADKLEQEKRMARFVADLAKNNHICYIVEDTSGDPSIPLLCDVIRTEQRSVYPSAPAHHQEEKSMPYSFNDLVGIVRTLRGKDGCPWDIQQDHHSLRENLIEESWEVVDAIDSGRRDRLYDELGDVLLQVVMHASIAEDEGSFALEDITDTICKKLIYRHPHIFKDVQVSGADEVLVNWEALKKKEKGLKTQADVLRDVPESLPSALRAHKVQKKARQVGFDWDDPEDAFRKVEEELQELRDARRIGDEHSIEQEAGDLLFSCVNAARLCGVNSELALHSTTKRFTERFDCMERLAAADGLNLADMRLEDMDKYWEKAKKSLHWDRLD